MNYSSRQQPDKHWLRKVDWVLVATIAVLAISVFCLLTRQWAVVNTVLISVSDKFLLHFRCNFCRYHHVYFT